MSTINLARFTINGTPSEDPVSGKRGFDASPGQKLTVTLERNPAAGALTVEYRLPDPTDSAAPLGSKDAVQQTWDSNSDPKILTTEPNASFDCTLSPSTELDSYVIRCTVSTDQGAQVFERMVVVRRNGLRNVIPAERAEYEVRGWADAIAELIEYVASGAFQQFDWQDSVLSRNENTPPGSPSPGDRYLIGSSPTGAWASFPEHITEWNGSAWEFTPQSDGQAVWVEDEDILLVYNGTNWVQFGLGSVSAPTGAGDARKVAFAIHPSGNDLDYADNVRISIDQAAIEFGTTVATLGSLRGDVNLSAWWTYSGTDRRLFGVSANNAVIGGSGVGVIYFETGSGGYVALATSTGFQINKQYLLFDSAVSSPIIQQAAKLNGNGADLEVQAQPINISTGGPFTAGDLLLKGGRVTGDTGSGTSSGGGVRILVGRYQAGAAGWLDAITAREDGNGLFVGLGANYANAGLLRLPGNQAITVDKSGAGTSALNLAKWTNDFGGGRMVIGDSDAAADLDLVTPINVRILLDGTSDPTTVQRVEAGTAGLIWYKSGGNIVIGFSLTWEPPAGGSNVQIKAQPAHWSGGDYDGGDVEFFTGNKGGSGDHGDAVIWFGNESQPRFRMFGSSATGGVYLYKPSNPSVWALLNYGELWFSNDGTFQQCVIRIYQAPTGIDAGLLYIIGQRPGSGATNTRGGHTVLGSGEGLGSGPGDVIIRHGATWSLAEHRGAMFAIRPAENAGTTGSRLYYVKKHRFYESMSSARTIFWNLDPALLLPDEYDSPPTTSMVINLKWTILSWDGSGASFSGVCWARAVLVVKDTGVLVRWNHPTELTVPGAYGCALIGGAPDVQIGSGVFQLWAQPDSAGHHYCNVVEATVYHEVP